MAFKRSAVRLRLAPPIHKLNVRGPRAASPPRTADAGVAALGAPMSAAEGPPNRNFIFLPNRSGIGNRDQSELPLIIAGPLRN
jgi:hypothetical protein